ncbi:MAG: acetyl-CoA acetyltransferase [Rhodospirillaceae bacterium]|jgi:acetyl-CoA C-acetyltransferase|nr:acetyl-CoA acetyltransferase [Rhodospirillaceae bacterium]MBT3932373.1 acetyl-CoA acetyltransferase [Rhodospirillaceae bacterium]MBT4773693.1 acetyl-CoA acetyltransferase [Rhodospirillaceae bacterium]MBT5358503.1 acetyl-CoA acetyltransferase [Rhodospirillaceae bacterium]MBT5770640.1 acetyl-CoA acetyltransferase [Rhodospirillaceae bacterium]
MTACIVGWDHLKFGKRVDDDIEDMIVSVATGAMRDAGVEPKDVDAIYLGTFGGGFVNQEFPASLVLQAHEDLRFKPSTHVENACATGSAAIYQGLNHIAAKRGRIVLCVGVEKMTDVTGEVLGGILSKASYLREESASSFAEIFGQITDAYFQKYGDKSDALAMIAAKNHKNGCDNPYAQMQKDLGYDFCRNVSEKNPIVAGPLKRTDCSLVSDGAAAIVLTDVDTALKMDKAVYFRAAQHVQDYLPMSRRTVIDFEGPAEAFSRAFAEAGISIDDLGFAEVHDCFTSAELLSYEAMGLTAKGQGEIAIKEGWTYADGKLPVNRSGGLKSKGHPLGATGLSMHAIASMQLTGTAGDLQLDSPKLGAVFNMGGSAVSSYVSILEPLR